MSFKEALAENSIVGKMSDGWYKAKPTVLVVGGMIGTAVAGYLAWRAGRKHQEVIEEVQDDISEVHEKKPVAVDEETGEVIPVQQMSKKQAQEYRLELAKVYIKAAYKLGKVYAPAIITEAAALVAIGNGFGILNTRFSESVAAFAALSTNFSNYRKRVVEDLGEEKDQEYYYSCRTHDIEEPELDEDGKPKLNKKGEPKVKKTKKVVLEDELAKHSMYAMIFDEDYSTQFEVNKDGTSNEYYNEKYVKDLEAMLNYDIKYQPNHMLTMNQIYDRLGPYDQPKKFKHFGHVTGYHCKIDPVTSEWKFDGGIDRIKIVSFPVYYTDENTGEMKKSYILDFNTPGNILGYFDEEDDNGNR